MDEVTSVRCSLSLLSSHSVETIAANPLHPLVDVHFPPLAGQRPGHETGILQVLLNFTIPFLTDLLQSLPATGGFTFLGGRSSASCRAIARHDGLDRGAK